MPVRVNLPSLLVYSQVAFLHSLIDLLPLEGGDLLGQGFIDEPVEAPRGNRLPQASQQASSSWMVVRTAMSSVSVIERLTSMAIFLGALRPLEPRLAALRAAAGRTGRVRPLGPPIPAGTGASFEARRGPVSPQRTSHSWAFQASCAPGPRPVTPTMRFATIVGLT